MSALDEAVRPDLTIAMADGVARTRRSAYRRTARTGIADALDGDVENVSTREAMKMSREVDASVDRNGEPSLAAALRLREPTAIEQLVTTYGDGAYRLAIRITGSEQDAEEVVQDAFWTVVRKIDSFRGDSVFASWLFPLVANAAYQKLRGRRGWPTDLSLGAVLPPLDEQGRHHGPVADWSARAQEPALQSEIREVLTRAIDELPADYRTALVLRDVEGVSNVAIGEVLGISLAYVKSRVHHARLFLRKRLGDHMATP
jgi:RNA polymerase sigma-70 factor, ECF subfamily